jgi:signal transduction histidine kinase
LEKLFTFLKGVYFFAGLSDGDIEIIQSVCHEVIYRPAEIICVEGSSAERFYIVRQGTVEVWKDYQSTDRDLLAVLEAGHLFGEMALIDDLPRSATVVARDLARLFYITRDDFHQVLINNSRISLSIMRSISDMVRTSNEYFVENLRARNVELEKTNRALQEAQEELLRQERLSNLGKFSSLILHDIRNPISVMRGLSEMILMHAGETERIEGEARNIIMETDRLNGLVNELLDYSRGEVRLNMSIVDPEKLIEDFVRSIEDRFLAKSIEIRTSVRCSDPIIVDQMRMNRVFHNLADNARKAMPQGGVFSLDCRKTAKSLRIEIHDTGVGMPAEVQDKIFEPFFSFSAEGGTGLGMSIVKSIVEAHKGSLLLESEVNSGTTFTIFLPLYDKS